MPITTIHISQGRLRRLFMNSREFNYYSLNSKYIFDYELNYYYNINLKVNMKIHKF